MKVSKRKGEKRQMIVDLIPYPDCMKKYINLVDITLRRKWYYILIRYPAQTNIKHLLRNKQPQLGCVNTSRVQPSLLCLHQ